MVRHPRLRHVEAFLVEQNGTQGVCLRDPFRYTDAMLFVPAGLVPLLQLLDGSRSLEDIRGKFSGCSVSRSPWRISES